MNDYKNFCEYVTHPKPTGGNKLTRVLLIILYTLFSAAYIYVFWLNLQLWAMIILLPFLMYAIIRLTWKYVNVEYEYAIEAGELSISAIYSGSSRRLKRRAQIPEMTLIAPYREDTEGYLRAPDIIEVKWYADEDSEAAYICVCPDQSSGKKRAIVIETTEEARRILHLCNPTVFRK